MWYLYNYKIPFLFFLPLPPGYIYAVNWGRADPTKKNVSSFVIQYHTYNLQIHIYIKTYIHIYNSMYRDIRDNK
jgi:hypothetical protein